MKQKKQKVQLVLGSGGARGIAHIGVIQMLEQEGYEIVGVYGCSMGAIVGGLYCSGFLQPYTDWLVKQSKSDMYRLFDISFSMQGFLKGEKIFAVLEHMAGKQMIEDLPIEFVAVATDILHRKEVHFTSGDLYKALRASSGIPGVFTPIAYEKSLFVDGGVLNPLPVDIVPKRKDTIVIAVNLNGAVPHDMINDMAPENKVIAGIESGAVEILGKLRHFFSHAKTIEEKAMQHTEPHIPTLSMFELLSESYDASLDRMVELMLKMHPVDILIEIPRTASSVFEFYRAAELIEVGKNAYAKSMSTMKSTKDKSTAPIEVAEK